MASVACRDAVWGDAAFLARAMQEADRGHTGVGSWDIVFSGTEERRLGALARLAGAGPRSHVHWSKFVVAELDGRSAAAAAGYVPDETPPRLLLEAAAEAQIEASARAGVAGEGETGAWSHEYFAVELSGDTLRVEWVYTAAEYRGRG